MIFEAVFPEFAKEKALKNAAGRRSSLGDPLRGLLSVQSGRFPGSGERIRKFYRKFTESFTKVYPQILHIVLDILGKNGYNTV